MLWLKVFVPKCWGNSFIRFTLGSRSNLFSSVKNRSLLFVITILRSFLCCILIVYILTVYILIFYILTVYILIIYILITVCFRTDSRELTSIKMDFTPCRRPAGIYTGDPPPLLPRSD